MDPLDEYLSSSSSEFSSGTGLDIDDLGNSAGGDEILAMLGGSGKKEQQRFRRTAGEIRAWPTVLLRAIQARIVLGMLEKRQRGE